ncbi:hypothetical protein V1514DRAFT_98466 [Lipomyces japonicus]|uniref:uncharacterized protein n=1 Tax=Lipomyces japonicus TaxID=56871 RepID=UPI0034CEA9F5
MSVIESCGLLSPNPSLDSFNSQEDEKVFEKAFQRVFEDRRRFDQILEERLHIDNPLPTPNSEACLSSDETENDHEDHHHHHHDEEALEYPFPSVEFSLFYPDTAPRDSWRPQLETWIRRNHSYKIDRVQSKPYSAPAKRPSFALRTSSSSSSSSSSFSGENEPLATSPTKKATNNKSSVHAVDTGLRSPTFSMSRSPIHSATNNTPAVNIKSCLATPPSPALSSPPSSSSSSSSGRRCISCGSDQSPCWRPSWSIEAGQLCNSCGLRYKKTGARCLSPACGRIPAKGEWVAMRSSQPAGRYSCLYCGGGVAVGENSKR